MPNCASALQIGLGQRQHGVEDADRLGGVAGLHLRLADLQQRPIHQARIGEQLGQRAADLDGLGQVVLDQQQVPLDAEGFFHQGPLQARLGAGGDDVVDARQPFVGFFGGLGRQPHVLEDLAELEIDFRFDQVLANPEVYGVHNALLDFHVLKLAHQQFGGGRNGPRLPRHHADRR